MKMNPTMSHTNRLAEMYYDFIDANANMKRAEWIARQVDNGLHAAINLIVMGVVLVAAIFAAWFFDFHSTTTALEGIMKLMIPSLPVALQTANIISIITVIVTVTPSLTENFLTGLARSQIAVVKVFVLGFSIFDMITDIPTTKKVMDLLTPAIYDLGPILGFGIYWLAFFGLLLMATVGFQVSVAVFAYTFAIYARKTFSNVKIPFTGTQYYNYTAPQQQQRQQSQNNNKQQQQQHQPQKTQVVEPAQATVIDTH